MKNLSEYINQLNFDYLKTYSGFQQEVFEKQQAVFEQKMADLQERLLTSSPQKQELIQNRINETQLRWEREQFDFREIAGPDGALIQSATKIAHLPKVDPVVCQIVEILNTPFQEQYHWMCWPVFRDSIVFYRADHTVAGIVHICLGCDQLADHQRQFFEADYKIFPQLRSVLKSLGHKVR